MKYRNVACLVLLAATVALGHQSGVVESVVPGSGAAGAGVRAGDRIISIGGRKLATRADLDAIVAAHRAGQTVPMVVERDGKVLGLEFTFGARPDGGPSIGVAVRLEEESAGPGTERDAAAAECLAWIEDRYRVESAMRELSIGRDEDRATILACVDRDMHRISLPDPVRFCDNVFKVHCSAADLLAEIGETWIDRRATALGASLGRDVGQDKAWRTCAKPRLYERYVLGEGLPSVDACRTALDACLAEDARKPGTTP